MSGSLTKATMNPALRSFWTVTVNEKGERVRNRVLYGGRASSKTWDAAAFAIFLASNYRAKFLCVRQFQARIADSVYAILVSTIDRFGLRDQFKILETSIIHRRTGSEFVFYGLWRSINEIRGMEGIDICWIEEAHALTEEQWKVLNPTLRNEGSQFWTIWNPQLSTDFVWKRFVANPPRGTLIRSINYNENPFLSSTMRELIADAREEDYDEYEHIYLGVPRDDDDDAVIKRSWIMAAIDAHKALGIDVTGFKRIGYDVADGGKDKCAMVYAHGPLASWADLWKAGEHESMKSATRVWNAAGQRDAQVIYDDIGVGAPVGSNFNILNAPDPITGVVTHRIQHRGFNAGGAVYRPDSMYANTRKSNKDMFANLKAQAWWGVADRFRNTFNAVRNGKMCDPADMIFIDGDMPFLSQLIDELSTPKRDYDNAGRVKVESKKDLAKPNRIGGPRPSPNLADAFICAFAPGGRPMIIGEEAMAAA